MSTLAAPVVGADCNLFDGTKVIDGAGTGVAEAHPHLQKEVLTTSSTGKSAAGQGLGSDTSLDVSGGVRKRRGVIREYHRRGALLPRLAFAVCASAIFILLLVVIMQRGWQIMLEATTVPTVPASVPAAAVAASLDDDGCSGVTIGIKHMSDYVERRVLVAELLLSIRARYAPIPIVVAVSYTQLKLQTPPYVELWGDGVA